MQSFLLVGLGGAIGSMARFGMSGLVARLWPASFPLATLLTNILGSLVMGVFVGLMARLLPPWQEQARLFLAVGVVGGFTTFSSFSLETITLFERGELVQAGAYVLFSVALSLAGLYLGLLATRGMA